MEKIDKKKIIKIDVYSFQKGLVLSSYVFNVTRDERTNFIQLLIKGSNIREIEKGTQVEVILYYINGDRVKYDTTIDVCTEFQINVTLGDKCTMLEERRRYYKLDTDLNASIAMLSRGDEDIIFEEPVFGKFKNINIGGVFLICNYEFKAQDIIVISFKVLGKELDLSTKILRVEKDGRQISGYGCQFLKLKNWQEEVLARYIHKIQTQEIDGLKKKINSR